MKGRIAANPSGSKARGQGQLLALGTLALASLLVGACGDESRPSPRGLVSAQTGGKAGGGAGGTGGMPATGGSSTVNVTGGSSGSAGNAGTGTGASAGATTDGACQTQDFAATRVPLDLYVMLDSSDSMLEPTGNTTKWDAVENAIRSFVSDPESAGIGIGLQFFPLQDPAAPVECRSDADCTGFGTCSQRFCQDAGPGFYGCGQDSQCVFNGEDLGPCVPLTHCWSTLVDTGNIELCHNDNECGTANDCIRFAHCGTDDYRFCNAPGRDCSGNYGPCVEQGPPSKCEHWASCSADTYAAPAVDIAELPAVAPAILAAITALDPEGNTPSAPALQGAIEHAHDWAVANPTHHVAVVLATDGLPSECIADPNGDPGGILGVTAEAAAGFADTPSVGTFVIGVFSADETDAPGNLDQIARAGGTDRAFIVTTDAADVEQQFLNALDTIRGEGIACELQIPVPESGKPDFGRVNVYFTESDTGELLYYATDEAGCAAGKGDWYYGLDDAGHPTKIIACPATCARFQAATTGKVTIGVGCLTVVR